MEDVDIVVVGGGVCGVLAARRFAQEGFTYKIIERNNDYGGVWAYRANEYSHLQVSERNSCLAPHVDTAETMLMRYWQRCHKCMLIE